MSRVLVLALLSGCGRLGFSDMPSTGVNDSGAPADELGFSQDAVILGDGIAAPACGTTPLLQDGFDVSAPGPTFGTYTDNGLTLREINSRLEVVFNSSVSDGRYAGYKAVTATPTEGLCAIVRVVQVAANNGISFFKLTSGLQQVEFAVRANFLQIRTHLDKQVATLLSIAFDPSMHAYWRLRQQGGVTYWDTSADGTAFTALASTTFVTDPMLFYELGAGSFGATSNGGIAAFDDAALFGP